MYAIGDATTGITLVALVVTIVVLLILAGITLVYVFGDNSIFKLAQEAKNKTDDAIRNEQEDFGDMVNLLRNEYSGGSGNGNNEGGGGNTTDPVDPPTPEEPTIVGVIDKIQEDTITVEDANKNPITIPGGFKVVPNSPEGTEASKKVEYTYNGDGTPAVQDGIVIEDVEGNQFVWVPVGTINNKQGDTTHGATSTITLGRYEDFTVKTDEDGNKYYQPKQTVAQYKKAEDSTQTDLQYQNTYKIAPYYMELTKKIGGNEIAESLGSFLESATTKGGYYLARYEASEGKSNKPMSKANQTVWGSTGQANAATYARGMYDATDPMKSDLVNSYAWDTAIIFIQTYSKDNSNYANQTTKKSGSSPFATGTSGDSACNIHDMASNCSEWSTEYSDYYYNSYYIYPWVHRGGCCLEGSSIAYTSYRGYSVTSNSNRFFSFRPLLYIKLN